VHNASGNSVAPTNDAAIFGGTADFNAFSTEADMD
jgi:hypothetical protein